MKKVKSHERPKTIEAVGNGTYRINYDIVPATPLDAEDTNPGWEYSNVKVDAPTYENIVSAMIRAQYSLDEELSILRQREDKPSKYIVFNEYCEQCKQTAREILGMECNDCEVPEYVTATQLKLQLVQQGYSENAIEDLISSIEDENSRTEAMIRYQTARNFYRSNELIAITATLLGWTEEQIDNFFIEAKKR